MMADQWDAEYFILLEHQFDEPGPAEPDLTAILRIGLDAFDQLEEHLNRSPELSARQFRSLNRALASIRDGRAALYSAVDQAGRATAT